MKFDVAEYTMDSQSRAEFCRDGEGGTEAPVRRCLVFQVNYFVDTCIHIDSEPATGRTESSGGGLVVVN